MNEVFADTSFYIAFASPKDRWHQEARSFALAFPGTMLTTEFVLIELGNYFWGLPPFVGLGGTRLPMLDRIPLRSGDS